MCVRERGVPAPPLCEVKKGKQGAKRKQNLTGVVLFWPRIPIMLVLLYFLWTAAAEKPYTKQMRSWLRTRQNHTHALTLRKGESANALEISPFVQFPACTFVSHVGVALFDDYSSVGLEWKLSTDSKKKRKVLQPKYVREIRLGSKRVFLQTSDIKLRRHKWGDITLRLDVSSLILDRQFDYTPFLVCSENYGLTRGVGIACLVFLILTLGVCVCCCIESAYEYKDRIFESSNKLSPLTKFFFLLAVVTVILFFAYLIRSLRKDILYIL